MRKVMKLYKLIILFSLIISILSVDSVFASEFLGFFNKRKCDHLPKVEEPAPDWFTNKAFKKPGFYFGRGVASNRKSMEEYKNASWQDALNKLASKIKVVVKSKIQDEMESTTKGDKNIIESNIEIITETSVLEKLVGVETLGTWIDVKKCDYWTLVSVSQKSVQTVKEESIMEVKFNKMLDSYKKGTESKEVLDFSEKIEHLSDALFRLDDIDFKYLPGKETYNYYQQKFEKSIMKVKFNRMHDLYDKGTENKEVRNLNNKIELLSNALSLLDELDFKILQEERKSDFYQQKFNAEIARFKNKLDQNRSRILISHLLQSDKLSQGEVDKIIGHMMSLSNNIIRLSKGCDIVEHCRNISREKGFGRLALVKMNKDIKQSSMGAYKGTLSVEVTFYNVQPENDTIIKGPVFTFGQVMGWTEENLNWDEAIGKIIKSNKFTFLRD